MGQLANGERQQAGDTGAFVGLRIGTNIWRYGTLAKKAMGISSPPTSCDICHWRSRTTNSYVDELATWLDPMAGSGTVLRAAVDLGRRAVGAEIHEPYCEIIHRMAQAVLFRHRLDQRQNLC